jgi:hypothetical protein
MKHEKGGKTETNPIYSASSSLPVLLEEKKTDHFLALDKTGLRIQRQQDPPLWAPDLPFRQQRRRDAEGERPANPRSVPENPGG